MKRWAWILGWGLGLQALVGCSPAYVAQTAQRNPTCEDQCILAGGEDLSMCLRACGGGDFTDRLGCQADDHRQVCGAPPFEREESASDSFILGVIGTVAEIAQTASDINDIASGGDDASDAEAEGASDLDQPAVEPAGPAPEERYDAPKREPKRDRDREPAKPSKSRKPAEPSKG